MKLHRVFGKSWKAVALVACFCVIAAAQNQGWQVVRADYGSGNSRVDVTNRVQRLLSGNGRVPVNNQTMGGDPAVGKDKTLRIAARNVNGANRQFTYKEGESIDASMF